jgi:hypothetical protein
MQHRLYACEGCITARGMSQSINCFHILNTLTTTHSLFALGLCYWFTIYVPGINPTSSCNTAIPFFYEIPSKNRTDPHGQLLVKWRVSMNCTESFPARIMCCHYDNTIHFTTNIQEWVTQEMLYLYIFLLRIKFYFFYFFQTSGYCGALSTKEPLRARIV